MKQYIFCQVDYLMLATGSWCSPRTLREIAMAYKSLTILLALLVLVSACESSPNTSIPRGATATLIPIRNTPTPKGSPETTGTRQPAPTVSCPSARLIERVRFSDHVDVDCDGIADFICAVYDDPKVFLVNANASRDCFFEYRTTTQSDAMRAYNLQNGIGPENGFIVSQPVQRDGIWIVQWREPAP